MPLLVFESAFLKLGHGVHLQAAAVGFRSQKRLPYVPQSALCSLFAGAQVNTSIIYHDRLVVSS